MVLAALATQVDYTNFKNAANATVGGPKGDHAYMDFLHSTWASGLQMSPPDIRPKPRTYRFLDDPDNDPVFGTQPKTPGPRVKVPTRKIKPVPKGVKRGSKKGKGSK